MSISGHGGTGIIFSVGLMRLIAPEDAIAFITKQTGCGGGDCLLGRWETGGGWRLMGCGQLGAWAGPDVVVEGHRRD